MSKNTTGEPLQPNAFPWQTLPQYAYVPQGWQCPVCKSVYSPTTAKCFNCPPIASSGTTFRFTTTTGPLGTTSCNNGACAGNCSICKPSS